MCKLTQDTLEMLKLWVAGGCEFKPRPRRYIVGPVSCQFGAFSLARASLT